MSSISNIALSGMQSSSNKINQVAEKLATDPTALDADSVVEVKQAEFAFKANAQMIKVDDELQKTVLDLIA